MNTFKTPKGTELPFLNLKGKDYLQVSHRLVWFREDHPTWTINTRIIEFTPDFAVVSAEIRDGSVSLSTAHKMQTAKGFPGGYLEKAEAGAVGRALAFLGYGTTHAQELEEDESTPLSSLADSPVQRQTQMKVLSQAKEAFPNAVVRDSQSVGDYVPTFGKYKGQALSNFELKELQNYVEYIERKAKEDRKPLQGQVAEFIRAVEAYSQEQSYQT